jgi:hypothetical protein
MVGDIIKDVANVRHVEGDALDGAKLAVFENLEITLGEAANYFVFLIEGVPVHPKMRAIEYDNWHHDFEGLDTDWGSVGRAGRSDGSIISEN